jgi:hypothetical protein
MERGYPADACGASCLSFRAPGKPSPKIWPINLEMKLLFQICVNVLLSLEQTGLRPAAQPQARDEPTTGWNAR